MWRVLFLCCGCSFSAQPAIGDAPEPPIDAPDASPPDGPGRVRRNLIAFYTFDENGGATIFDKSGVAPALDVTIKTPTLVAWDVGLLVVNEMATPSEIAAPPPPGGRRITDACVNANAVTIEAWVISSAPDQTGAVPDAEQSARVITLSTSTSGRNFAIGQHGTQWQGQVRISGATPTDTQGNPALRGGLVTQTFQHLALTADATKRILYVDGTAVETDTTHPGTFGTWEAGYRLSFGNEVSLNNKWNGKLLMVAIYDRALSKDELDINRALGPDAP